MISEKLRLYLDPKSAQVPIYHDKVLAEAKGAEHTLAVEEAVRRKLVNANEDAKRPIVCNVHNLQGNGLIVRLFPTSLSVDEHFI